MSPVNVPVSTTVSTPDSRNMALTMRCLTIGGAGTGLPASSYLRNTRHSVKGLIQGRIDSRRHAGTNGVHQFTVVGGG
jgi:hypothetical protein